MTKEEFKNLFDLYFDAIRNYLYSRSGDVELSTDITQDVFLKIWEKRNEFKTNQKIKPLLYKMAGNQFIDHIRKNKSAEKYLEQIQLHFNTETPENHYEFQELKTKYEKALSDLSEKERTVYLMSRYDQLPYKEIAERLDLSIKAIEKRMSKALLILRKKLIPNE